MKSFEERFCVTRPGRGARLARDARLLWYLVGMAWRNLTLGAKVRRRYRMAMAKGEPLFVDVPPPGAASARPAGAQPDGARR
jgi:hypothetical protein